MQLVFLWTDLLIYVLCLSVFSFGWHARKKEYLLAPWRQVIRSRLGVIALIILLGYVAIGLLDSVHFKLSLDVPDKNGEVVYSSEVISLFDWLADPVRLAQEKTYSAPFATHLYSKETIELPNGKQTREYQRLVYGGAHLNDLDQRWNDVLQITVIAILKGIVIWSLLCMVIVFTLANRWKKSVSQVFTDIYHGREDVPWRTILITIGVMIVLLIAVISLSIKYHLFGTDKVGQDVFYQTIKSIRTGLVIGTLTTLIMLPFAVMLGIMAGYFRGWVDDIIQYLYTTLSSIPGVLLITAAILILQVYMSNNPDAFGSLTERADIRLLFLCIILGITSWTGLCRLLRAETLKLRELDYVQASTAFGVNNFAIILRHILPNVMHIVLISVVLDFSGLVLAEAVLSYVGVGVDPSMISWGNMINGARLEMAREPVVWWTLAASFVFMFILVLAANLFSDAVRDAFDPRLRSVR
jgi:peptide/nickel transport system permease protein